MPLEGETMIPRGNLRLSPSGYHTHDVDLHYSTRSPTPFPST